MIEKKFNIDPVCGMKVPIPIENTFKYKKKLFYFCCSSCKEKFALNPKEYTNNLNQHSRNINKSLTKRKKSFTIPQSANQNNFPESSVMFNSYICPMHTEISQQSPGACSICGMDLENISLDNSNEVDSEDKSIIYRFRICLAFWMPLLLSHLSFILEIDYLTNFFSTVFFDWFQIIAGTITIFWGGLPFFIRAWTSLLHKSLNMFSLVCLGIMTSYFYSIFLFITEKSYSYFGTGIGITVLVLLGQVLERKARRNTHKDLQRLLTFIPATAVKIGKDKKEEKILLDKVNVGDTLRVFPGQRIPTDATVLSGTSEVDESVISGESLPVQKKIGSKVLCSTLNYTGSLTIRVDKVGKTTLLYRIIELVKKAQYSQPPIQNLADRISSYIIPFVLFSSAITFLFWFLTGPKPSLHLALTNAISVLVIACPCSIGLAAPMSIVVAMGKSARKGVIFKTATPIELTRLIDTIVFDKTGTLTNDNFHITKITACEGYNEKDVLFYASNAAIQSNHPLSAPIISLANRQKIEITAGDSFESIPAKGIVSIKDHKKILMGSQSLLENHNINLNSSILQTAEDTQNRGETVIFVSYEKNFIGIISVSINIDEKTIKTIKTLMQKDIEIFMVTGDNNKTARQIANKLEIANVYSETSPQKKLEIIKLLQNQNKFVCMVGDGINDAPALAQAQVGIAVGTGTDIALESADITLLKGNLNLIPQAIDYSRLTVQNIKQNLFWSFFYNIICIPIAAGVLYPLGFLLNPTIAAAAMSFSSISVIFNSLLLRNRLGRE